ncbi:esterase B1-like [Musca autumnalis]|uniref:esterase B1-like n=1 Tax=Musca autumnalis TaxID=221902 RepID=UPI003CE788B9
MSLPNVLKNYVLSSLKIREIPLKRYFNISLAEQYSVRFCGAIRSGLATMDSGEQNPIVKITQGLVRGTKSTTIYDDDYYSFEGIPYGQPPLGDLRFKAPLPVQPWDGVKDCLEFSGKPLQKNYQGEIEGSEDCLYLNVYAKTLNAEKKLPVLVWIYGGAFNTGSCIKSKYGPDYFMQEDVILVTFNYRLSVFGFLSLTDPSLNVPGNAGLKDQVLALKWVQQNIDQFGGDNENITLFGESAGAAAVHFMMCTEQTKGLFHKAICQSGCILNNWALTKDTTDLAYRLACEMGYQGENNDAEVLEFLQKCPANELFQMDKLNQEAILKGSYFAFVPSIEPYDNSEAVIRKPLLESMKTSWSNSIPLIIGGNSFEGLVRYPAVKHKPELLELCKTRPELLLPPELLVSKSNEETKLLGKVLYDLYFKGLEDNQQQFLMHYLEHASFYSFWHDLHRVVKSRKELATAPTYQYLFDFDSPTFNHHRKMFCGSDIQEGVAHADDLAYLFNSFYSWKLEKDSKEYLTIRRMIELWVNFAKSSNPNCQHTKDSEWQTISQSNTNQWLKISNDIRFEEMPKEFQHKLDVWNSLYGSESL